MIILGLMRPAAAAAAQQVIGFGEASPPTGNRLPAAANDDRLGQRWPRGQRKEDVGGRRGTIWPQPVARSARNRCPWRWMCSANIMSSMRLTSSAGPKSVLGPRAAAFESQSIQAATCSNRAQQVRSSGRHVGPRGRHDGNKWRQRADQVQGTGSNIGGGGGGGRGTVISVPPGDSTGRACGALRSA